MNGQAYESLFGPPSELLDVAEFLNSTRTEASNALRDSSNSGPLSRIPGHIQAEWAKLSEEQQKDIAIECSVEDLSAQLQQVIGNPRLMAHTMQTHELFVQSVQEGADTSSKKKRKRITVTEPAYEHLEIRPLRSSLDAVQLQSWPLTSLSALFIRSPKHSDHNTSSSTKCLSFSSAPENPHQALLFVTIYNPLAWGHRLLSRASQHVLLSSQTLGDLFDVIPCASNEIPQEYVDANGHTRWDPSSTTASAGSVMCIEDLVYGDGQTEKDYAEKLVEHLDTSSAKSRPDIGKGPAMHDTTLSSLSFRLHKPYWVLHAGDCEHFFVFEHVRSHHPSDPPLSKYPLTTQITPPLLDTCRACSKAPAVYAVSGDLRLGEAPFVICAPCWRWMGDPKPDEQLKVMVVPLPKYEHGWGG